MPGLNTLKVWAVKRKEARNIIENPSFEVSLNGWLTYSGMTATRDEVVARRGKASCRLRSTTNGNGGIVYTIPSSKLKIPQVYTLSLDIMTDTAAPSPGLQWALGISDENDNIIGSSQFTLPANIWSRVSMSFNLGFPVAYIRVVIATGEVSSLWPSTYFWIDGVQLEEGGESTFIDGNYTGYQDNLIDFYWMGTPDASAAYRSGETGRGGELILLNSLCDIIGFTGLGMPEVEHSATALNVGSRLDNTAIKQREFSIIVTFRGGNAAENYVKKSAMQKLLMVLDNKDPVLLYFQLCDSSGYPVGRRCFIEAFYKGGLESIDVDQRRSEAIIEFTAMNPFVVDDGEIGRNMGVATPFSYGLSVSPLFVRTKDGDWTQALSATLPLTSINAIVRGPLGKVYFGGERVSGIRLTQCDYGVSTGFSDVSPGPEGTVNCLLYNDDGNLYVGGAFSNCGGLSGADNIAAWDGGSAWTALGTGTNGDVYCMAKDGLGNLYAGGQFTNAGGVTVANIAKWTGDAWVALGNGVAGTPMCMICDQYGVLYVGGVTAAGGAAVNLVASWDGAVWSQVGDGLKAGDGPGGVYALKIDKNGRLWAGGGFTKNGSDDVVYNLAYFNGTKWTKLGLGIGGGSAEYVKSIDFDEYGNLYACGSFLKIPDHPAYSTGTGDRALPSKIVKLSGGRYYPLDLYLPFWTPEINVISFIKNSVYVGFDAALSDLLPADLSHSGVSDSVTLKAPVYPTFVIAGPCRLICIQNWTTKKSIYFNRLIIPDGDTVRVCFTHYGYKVYSDFRGDLSAYIDYGSDLDFLLDIGQNTIRVFATYYTHETYVVYTPNMLSIESSIDNDLAINAGRLD
jgi:hypothetical protein